MLQFVLRNMYVLVSIFLGPVRYELGFSHAVLLVSLVVGDGLADCFLVHS